MITSANEEKLVSLFFYQPMSQFGVRELSREAKMDTKTVMKYLKVFVKEGIVVKIQQKNKYPYYEANRLSKQYKFVKSANMLAQIAMSGLLSFLEETLKPKAMVLFGSMQKGTYHKKSDIDIFIQEKETKIDVSVFEKKLKHEIQLFFEEDLNNLTEGLRNNIISGNTLSGGLRL